MNRGLWHLTESYDGPTLSAGAALVKVPGWNDFWSKGATKAAGSTQQLARGMFVGLHSPEQVAEAARAWGIAGWEWQDGNEPNHPVEKYNMDPEGFALWCEKVARASPDVRRWYAAPSPGFGGWQRWLDNPVVQRVIREHYHGVGVHAYGTIEEVKAILEEVEAILPGVPKILAETNPGWGRPTGDYGGLAHWSKTQWPGILALCKELNYEAVIYFAWDGYSEPNQPEDLSARQEPLILQELINKTIAVPVSPIHVIPPPGAIPVNDQELAKFITDLWKPTPYVPTHAIPAYWTNQLRRAVFLGKPLTSEITTENGRYIYQVFTAATLWCEKNVWVVREGLPPFE